MTALLTCATVAEQLGVSRKTVLRWTAAGILPGFRLPGGGLRFREDAIEAWLSERATPAPADALEPLPAAWTRTGVPTDAYGDPMPGAFSEFNK